MCCKRSYAEKVLDSRKEDVLSIQHAAQTRGIAQCECRFDDKDVQCCQKYCTAQYIWLSILRTPFQKGTKYISHVNLVLKHKIMEWLFGYLTRLNQLQIVFILW